jgi:hypothetical protein
MAMGLGRARRGQLPQISSYEKQDAGHGREDFGKRSLSRNANHPNLWIGLALRLSY